MLIERALTEHDLPLLAQIDRSELVEECYRLENGELILYPVHFDMRGWPEGEAEENALALAKCLRRGGWLYVVFAGQALVAAVVVDNRVIHNQGLSMRQLKFLHISRDYRGQGWGRSCWRWLVRRGGGSVPRLCMFQPPSRAIPWISISVRAVGWLNKRILSCSIWSPAISIYFCR
jgi:predicted N-acetyltransferase YhbS